MGGPGIIIDSALEKRAQAGNPVRVGVVGSGFMVQGFIKTVTTAVPGMRVVGVCNRNLERPRKMLTEVGGMADSSVVEANTIEEMQAAFTANKAVITSNWKAFVEWEAPECILEVTGTIEYSSHVITTALRAKKHVVAMNAELDATLGPLLKKLADENGVVFSNSDGDQPGVIMNLYRYVKSIGFRPVVAGNIKGFHDITGNPRDKAWFAKKTKQNPYMVASFCDGSKVSFENVTVANATGMRVPVRGMFGKTLRAPVEQAASLYNLDELLEKGPIVDYVVGLTPNAGVFVLGYSEDPLTQHYMSYYKQGTGPLYAFYTPYHLCHVEVPMSCARAVLFNDAVCAAKGAPVGDVIAVAKEPLQAGRIIDPIGGFCVYGLAEDSLAARQECLLPLGLANGCRLIRDVPINTPLTWRDVEVPAGRLCDALWAQQNEAFGLPGPGPLAFYTPSEAELKAAEQQEMDLSNADVDAKGMPAADAAKAVVAVAEPATA